MKQISDELYHILRDNLALEDHGSSKTLITKNPYGGTLVTLSEIEYSKLLRELEDFLRKE